MNRDNLLFLPKKPLLLYNVTKENKNVVYKGSQIVIYNNVETKDVLIMPDVLLFAVGDGSYLINFTMAPKIPRAPSL
jgi:hypothetical protein